MTIELVNVTKVFPGFTLGPINLNLPDDTILVLLGPNGSGKSTILNLIIGLIKPDTGSIYIDGADIAKIPVESRKIGYSFQNPTLFPHLSVYENIVFGLKKGDKKLKGLQIKNLCDSFGISHLLDRRKINGLSGGEMQKISLARMLVKEPKIMLMDEPLAHLDNLTKNKLRMDLRQILKEEKVLGIYVTHFEDDVYALADSVSIIQKGQIKRTDTLRTMLLSEGESATIGVRATSSPSYSHESPTSLSSSSIFEIFQGDYNYLEGHVTESKDGVTIFMHGAHKFEILGDYPTNSTVGVLIKPEDILLSPDLVKTSARNIIKVRVRSISNISYLRKGVLDIFLGIDDISLKSRITVESKNYLGIIEGKYIYAIFKATVPHVVRNSERENMIK
ncbi:MAG: ATP-binding cassette domain-containing protein [Candidatus Nitrosocosmicus sp.]|nr:ATP-binding cassette domain-containing protein [Candidatus Nitrosocosmicus sp.]MDN5867461.1 ATP-binding cassette domain-containing protein [Candidatus Nitrosocosmicus sp.]